MLAEVAAVKQESWPAVLVGLQSIRCLLTQSLLICSMGVQPQRVCALLSLYFVSSSSKALSLAESWLSVVRCHTV